MPFNVTLEFKTEKDANAFSNDVEAYNSVTLGEDDTTVDAYFVEMKEVATSVLEENSEDSEDDETEDDTEDNEVA